MFQSNLRPGEGFRQIYICKPVGNISPSGRASSGKYKVTDDTFLGIITNASQKEIDLWKQNNHPITHKVTGYGAQVKASAADILVTEDGMQLYVQGSKNPGGLDLTMIYYVEERLDMKREVE